MELVEINRNIRKNKGALNTSGYAMLALIIWGIAKYIFFIVLIQNYVTPGEFDYSDIVYVSVVSALSLLELEIEIAAGVICMKEYKNTGKIPAILRVLLILICFFATCYVAEDIYFQVMIAEFDLTVAIAMFMDVVYMAVCIIALVSFIKLRKLFRMKTEAENER